MSQLEQQMRYRDRDMVPRFLVVAMFSLMALTLAIVSFAQLSGAPNTGVLVEAPVVQSRTLTLEPIGPNDYALVDDGETVAASTETKAGFYSVIGKVVDRRRIVRQVEGNPPITVVRRDNGHIAVLDPATDFTIELIGYGADNVAAFARLLD